MKDEVLLDGRFGYGCNWDHEDLALKNKHSIYPKQYNSERLSFKGLVMAVNLKLQMVESANVVVLLGFKDNLMANGLPDGAMIFEIVRDENNLLQTEQFEIELEDRTGLLFEKDPEGLEDRGFGRMGIDLVKATLESMLGDGGSSSNSSNRITPTARPDLGTATIQ
ncbi:hypothetical protein PPACK8108_LOCUS7746 [Phakopsora pachyrhizi]|uniref:Uncharacterized protein n=1 Tax=Phakopsora pachyrhizi TaxID=170000 RepID=A0AAV0AVA4_PHAPC|nr:hypothetical protein PPACK8108_LOCUS7746 [Phakopsora pachyrhizi]